MDKEQFLKDFETSTRAYFSVKYAMEKKDWFDYIEYANAITENAKITQPNRKNYKGKPSASHKTIRYFIKIGFLLVDPIKGVKVNEDFTPKSQQKKIFLNRTP